MLLLSVSAKILKWGGKPVPVGHIRSRTFAGLIPAEAEVHIIDHAHIVLRRGLTHITSSNGFLGIIISQGL
jgi:hypothetical protein